MTPTPRTPDVARLCPECGAQYFPEAEKCWLCHANLRDTPVVVAELLAPPPATAAKLGESTFAVLSTVMAVLLVVLGIGIYAQEPALGVVYVFLVLPPLAVTVARTYGRSRSGQAVSWIEWLATFFISTVVMLGVLGLLAVAAIACLFFACLASFG